VAPTAIAKVVKMVRAIVLDLNLILSNLNDLDEPARFIKPNPM